MSIVSLRAKSALLVVGASLSILSMNARASQATVTVAAVMGGSSALLGDYSNVAGAAYRPGAIPSLVGNTSLILSGYRSTLGAKSYVLIGQATLSTGASVPALIEYTTTSTATTAGDQKVIILLRSDSGVGVQYVTNGVTITGWSSTWVSKGAFDNSAAAPGSDDATVETAVAALTSQAINAGISDVAAASIKDNASSAITLNQNANVHGDEVAVATLLQVYSNSVTGSQYNFTQAKVRELEGSGGPNTNTTDAFTWSARRELTSGTRITELLDAISPNTEFPPVSASDPSYVANTGTYTGTGALLTAINTTSGSFGYAFVTGAAGNNLANVLVGQYNGVTPYANSTANTTLSLPGNNGQSAYGSSNYYTNTANGTYAKWTYERIYTLNTNSTVASIVSALTSSTYASYIHQVGLTSLSDMEVTRESYTSDDPVFGDDVTDGGAIISL